jgi:hypothetical protein
VLEAGVFVRRRRREEDMYRNSLSTIDLEAFKEKVAAAVAGARSLDEIKALLTSQPFVVSVELTDYLLKSNPPQRDFIVEFKTADGSMIKTVVNIFDLGDQRFQFNKLRDQ